MRIHGVTVSVDYAPELSRSIAPWASGLASLTVVTTPEDAATIALAESAKARVVRTRAFYEDGAYFNKARALQEAREFIPAEGWHLLIDADVVPPEDWLERVVAAVPQFGMLYGARRVFEDGRPVGDRELAGFFQLWHSGDPRGRAPLGRDWLHAGCYDSDFMMRWPRDLQRILPLVLVHLGETGKNWCGRGNEAAVAEIRRRRHRGQSWRTETVKRAG